MRKVQEANHYKDNEPNTLEDFVKANLHYLSRGKQMLFKSINSIVKNTYKGKYTKKPYYTGRSYNGKG